jgi:hypothetical protein
MPWKLFDFVTERRVSVIAEWVKSERLSRRDVGQLNQKLDMLQIAGPSLPPKLLAGPIYKHIYKLILHGDRMLRPFLCKGPVNMEGEYTLLLGAIEANFMLDKNPSEAEDNRDILINNPGRRISHGRYK